MLNDGVEDNLPTDANDAGGTSQGAADGDFPIQLPDGLTADEVIRITEGHNKIWQAFWDKKGNDIIAYSRMYENMQQGPRRAEQNMDLPALFSIIETIQARVVPAIFGKPRLVDALPEFPSGNNENMELVTDFVNQQLLWRSRAPLKSKAMVKGLIIEGTAFARSEMRQELFEDTAPVYTMDPTGRRLYTGEEAVTRKRTIWDFTYISPMSLAWDPACVSQIGDAEWIRYRTQASINKLYQMQQDGIIAGVDKILELSPSTPELAEGQNPTSTGGGGGSGRDQDFEQKRRDALNGSGQSFRYGDEKKYRLDEWHATLTYRKDLPDGAPHYEVCEAHFFIVDEKVLVKFELNGLRPVRKPYVGAPFTLQPGEMLGIPLPKIILGLAQQINIQSGRQADLVTAVTRINLAVDSSAGIDTRTLYQKEKGIIPVTNIAGIKQLSLDPTSVQILQGYLNFLIQFMRDASAATEQAQGVAGAKTATEFQGLVQNAFTRFAETVDNFNQFMIAGLAKECYLMYRQFGDDSQMFARGNGPDSAAIPVTRDLLQPHYDFIPTTMQNEQFRQAIIKQDDALFQVLTSPQVMQAFAQAGKQFDLEKFFVEHNLADRQVKNGNDYIKDVPPMPPPGMPAAQPPGALPGMAPGMPSPGMGPTPPTPQLPFGA